VPLVGVWVCALCRAPLEGHAWDECRYCHSRPAWLPCPSCGLPVPRGGRR
jgi:predicted amidophosphoribosyltransferase